MDFSATAESANTLLGQSNNSLIPFSLWELAFIGLYLLSLLAIGVAGYRARKENSLKDFYLAGKGIGLLVLVLTLYATQYSGNTLFAFSGKTYRIGLSWIMCLHFMTAIIVFYQLIAPKLFALAKRHSFITPADFVQFRFQNRFLTVLVAIVMIVAIANFLVAQLMAMGRAFQGITSYDPDTVYIFGVILLAAIVVIYETLGGFRAVAWTDAIQGSVLMIGFIMLMVMVWNWYGPPSAAIAKIQAEDPPKYELLVGVPPLWRCVEWVSYVLFVGIGGAVYPQAIQRIYAAESSLVLKRSLAIMAFLPLATTLIIVIVGLYGIAFHPEVGTGASSDAILTVICQTIQESSIMGRILVMVIFAAIFAALMSTADSVLLSMSSMFTKDVYGRLINPSAKDKHLTNVGKIFSWVLIVIAVVAAIQLRHNQDLVTLLDRKFDMLIQVAPVFFLGLHWKKLSAEAATGGLLVGLIVAISLAVVFGKSKPFNIHPGIYGLVANVTICLMGSLWSKKPSSSVRG